MYIFVNNVMTCWIAKKNNNNTVIKVRRLTVKIKKIDYLKITKYKKKPYFLAYPTNNWNYLSDKLHLKSKSK